MKQFRAAIGVVLLLTMFIAGTVPSHVGASQAGVQSYTSSLSGQVIQTTGGWTIDSAAIEAADGTELIPLYGQFDGMVVAFLPAGTDLVAARDIFLGEFGNVFDNLLQIDRGAYGNVSYSLDITSAEGVEFGLFSLFLGQRESGFVEYYLYFAPVMAFQASMTTAVQSVTVGGKQVFDGVDPAGLQALLSANAGVTGASTQIPEGNVVEAPTEAPVPTTQPQTQTSSADGEAYLASIQAELVYLQGTLDDFLVNFVALGAGDLDDPITEISRLAGEWASYGDRAAGITAPEGFEDLDTSYRTVTTEIVALGDRWYDVVTAIQSQDDAAIDAAFDAFTLLNMAAQTAVSDLQAQIDSSGMETFPTAVPAPTELPAPAPTQEPTVAPAPTEETSTDGRVDINLGGKSRTGTSDKSDENETETGQGGQGSDLSQYEALGLVSEDEYVSPQFDVGLTWNENWYFDSSFETPIASDTETGTDKITVSWSGESLVTLFISIIEAEGSTPKDIADYYASYEYLSKSADPNAEVLLQETSRSGSSAVLTRDYLEDGTELSILRGVTCGDAGCKTLVIVTMISLPETMPEAYGDARSGIKVDDARLMDVFAPRDISGALAD